MPRNNVFKLAGAHRDVETKALLDRLVEQEAAGQIVGMVAITLCRRGQRKEYYISTTGWAESNPTLAVGAMASCQALLETAALMQAGLLSPE